MESGDARATVREEANLRQRAVERIKGKRDFLGHVVVFLAINAGLWVVWAIEDADTGDLWPAWVTGIWLVILVIDAAKVYGERPITDRRIEQEMDRIKGA